MKQNPKCIKCGAPMSPCNDNRLTWYCPQCQARTASGGVHWPTWMLLRKKARASDLTDEDRLDVIRLLDKLRERRRAE